MCFLEWKILFFFSLDLLLHSITLTFIYAGPIIIYNTLGLLPLYRHWCYHDRRWWVKDATRLSMLNYANLFILSIYVFFGGVFVWVLWIMIEYRLYTFLVCFKWFTFMGKVRRGDKIKRFFVWCNRWRRLAFRKWN